MHIDGNLINPEFGLKCSLRCAASSGQARGKDHPEGAI